MQKIAAKKYRYLSTNCSVIKNNRPPFEIAIHAILLQALQANLALVRIVEAPRHACDCRFVGILTIACSIFITIAELKGAMPCTLLCAWSPRRPFFFSVETRAADFGDQAATRSWNGFYIGAHAGLGAFTSHQQTAFGALPIAGTLSPVGRDGQFGPLFGGFQSGFLRSLGVGIVAGVEVEASFPDTLEAVRVLIAPGGAYGLENKIDTFGAIKARIGYAYGPWFFYATGGVGVAHDRLTHTQLTGNLSGYVQPVYQWRIGAAAGIGAEARLYGPWSMRLEALTLQFPKSGANFSITGQRIDSSLSAYILRAGLNYRFGGEAVKQDKALTPNLDNVSIHGQMTGIGQIALGFPSLYTGQKSLNPHTQLRDTVSATAFLGARLPTGTEVYFNPEPTQGFGLSRTQGFGGFPNGEAQKGGSNYPRYNTARLFARHVIGLGGEQEEMADGANQVAGKYDISRITLTAGKMAVPDIFDNNAYSHDGRSSFMNWGFIDAGAFDYSADQKGYTWGAVVELNQKYWAARAGYFLIPDTPNGFNFDTRLARRGQYIGELEGRYTLFGQPGKLRATGWFTRAFAGNFDEALAWTGGDIAMTRRSRPEYGFVANLEQAITDDLGVFSRLSWRSGKTEIVAWTDIDRSASMGAVLKGTSWGRPLDKVGVAGMINGLNNSYRSYLANGGTGINIGDGALNYRRELVAEGYYSIGLGGNNALAFDYQFVKNPGYNADRGPVSIASIRLHGEF
ncbi:MAG: carbohydrate porin [Hyphomicrobiales bacterium]|nr:carbohydrate porin [Hyphomicrobiales bacterium]